MFASESALTCGFVGLPGQRRGSSPRYLRRPSSGRTVTTTS